jgi:predicted transcriptional regulator
MRTIAKQLAILNLKPIEIQELNHAIKITVHLTKSLKTVTPSYNSHNTKIDTKIDTPDTKIEHRDIEQTFKILSNLVSSPKSKAEILKALGYTNNSRLAKRYLTPLIETGHLQMTIPDKPNSRNQQYSITPKGKQYLKNSPNLKNP